LSEVNGYLDDLVKSFDNTAKKVIISKLLKQTSYSEQKWLIRIILKDMKLGIGH
jgi:DNA ligase-4